MNAHRLNPATARVRVGIAGSLSGRRVAHAGCFRSARERLLNAGVSALLGDDASDPEAAADLAEEFALAGVGLVIGHFNSDCARAAIPIYRAHGVGLLLPASTANELPLGQGVYRLCANDAAQARLIAEWLRKQAEPAEVCVDRSEYAQRLLKGLRTELCDAMPPVRDLAKPGPAAPVRVVLALAHAACESLRQPSACRTALFSDEAAVSEFRQLAAESSTACSLVTPEPSYETLVAQACDITLRWCAHRPLPSFERWASASGCFLTSGESRSARWALQHLHLAATPL
jgi:branched-chain amino acid transport system substrate-binding protein